MLALILGLAVLGVILYLIEQLPMDAAIKLTIRVVVLIGVVLYLARLVGIADLPWPRL